MLGQLLVNGLVLGSGYAIMAVGHTIVFGLMKIANYAHGEMYMLGAYLAYTFLNVFNLPFGIGLGLSIASGCALAVVYDKVFFAKVRHDMSLSALVTIGLSIFITNIARYIWGSKPQSIKNPFSKTPIILGDVAITPSRIFIIGACIITILTLQIFMKYMRFGKAFRATYQNPDAAELSGINVKRIYTFSSVLGVGVITLAGALLGQVYSIEPSMGTKAGSVAWAVVVAGGMGNFPGAIVMGFFLGIAESLAGGYISSAYKDGLAYLVVVLILIFKPQGLFAKRSGKLNG